MIQMRLKIKLTPEEIHNYNNLKQLIITARTRSEINDLKNRAKSILESGRIRYIKELEQSKLNSLGTSGRSKFRPFVSVKRRSPVKNS